MRTRRTFTASLIVALLCSLSATASLAQTTVGDRFYLNTGPCTISSGSGSPEGVVVGKICDIYINTVDAVLWEKWTGNGTTGGWNVGHNANARVNGTLDVTGYVGQPGYVSQTTGWRIDALGAADFRYLYTDELHAKSFIADLEQALAGGQIIAKSVTLLASNFTNPAAGATATLTVRDLPSAENMAVFESGDTVRLRSFSRASGSLTIADSYGVVTSYADQAGGVQTWTYTRNSGANAGGMSPAVVIATDAIVIDYGVTGNGFHEVNAIDGIYGINSPYSQVVTWATSPIAANLTVRSRLGNLRGITGNTGEYGLIAGTYAASDGQYFRASNNAFELHGINLLMWDGATNTIKLDRTAPSFAMGSPVPSAYGTGVGCWQGKDGGVYKWRCGNPSGDRIEWNGTNLNVVGTVTITGGGAFVPIGGAAADVISGVATPSGSGLFLGSDKMGYYASGTWRTYMDNAGNFYLGGTGGALQWNGTTLTISATLSGNGSGITSISGGNITTGTVTATQIAANTITAGEIAADAITASELAAGSVTAGDIAAGTITATEIAASTITAAKLNVSTLSAITANLGTVNAGHINGATAEFGGGAVDLDANGLTLAAGGGDVNEIKWTDGSTIWSLSDNLRVGAENSVWVGGGTSGTVGVYFETGAVFPAGHGVTDLGRTGDRWRDVWVNRNIEVNNDMILDGELYLGGDLVWSPPTTTSADYPLVHSTATGISYRKTNGVNGFTDCGAPGFKSLDFHRGIVVDFECN